MKKIKLLIAEDETVVRYALAQLVGAEEDIDVVAEAGDGQAAVVKARRHRPDVVLMDLNMPKLDGITAARQIKEEIPGCAIVVLTIYHDDEHLFEAIRAAAGGEGFLHASLVSKVLDEFSRISRLRAAAKEVFAELTRREMQVLELLGEGLRNRKIAERLYISEKAVKNHMSTILAKLQVNDRTEAALLAARHGLTNPQ